MKTLEGALIGFGFIAERGHAPAYASGAAPLEIVAVAEPCAARHPAIRAALPRARIYDDHRALLAREPALDFVDVCAPPSEHLVVALDAFARGLHVLCEKPLAMTADEAMRMAGAAVEAGRVLFPGHSYGHAPVIRGVRDLLARDLIGPVRMATLDTYRTGHARGVAEWRPDWRREPRYSGAGILMDHGPHTSYLAFEWLGAFPTGVSAWTRSVRRDAVEDEATFTMVFPGGRIARAQLSWNAGFRRVIYTLHGDRGAIRVEDDEIELVVGRGPAARSDKTSHASSWMDAGHGPWFEGVLRGFAQAIARGDLVGAHARDAVMGMQVVSAALASAARGGVEVAVPPLADAVRLERCA